MTTSSILEKKSRVERLRELVKRIKKGEKLTAFQLAVEYDKTINVIYRNVSTLRCEGLIPAGFKFAERKN